MWLAAAAAFNLVCSGTLSQKSFQTERAEPYSYTYRIDLDAKKFCGDECKAISDIAEVQPGFIRLFPNKNIDTPRLREFSNETINRETGRHSALSTSGFGRNILIMKWEGKCERSAFTGFPEFKTKF